MSVCYWSPTFLATEAQARAARCARFSSYELGWEYLEQHRGWLLFPCEGGALFGIERGTEGTGALPKEARGG